MEGSRPKSPEDRNDSSGVMIALGRTLQDKLAMASAINESSFGSASMYFEIGGDDNRLVSILAEKAPSQVIVFPAMLDTDSGDTRSVMMIVTLKDQYGNSSKEVQAYRFIFGRSSRDLKDVENIGIVDMGFDPEKDLVETYEDKAQELDRLFNSGVHITSEAELDALSGLVESLNPTLPSTDQLIGDLLGQIAGDAREL